MTYREKEPGGRDRTEKLDIPFDDVTIIEATFVEEKALRPKIQIRVHSLDDLKRIAKHFNEILIKYAPEDKREKTYYIIFNDKYYVYNAACVRS